MINVDLNRLWSQSVRDVRKRVAHDRRGCDCGTSRGKTLKSPRCLEFSLFCRPVGRVGLILLKIMSFSKKSNWTVSLSLIRSSSFNFSFDCQLLHQFIPEKWFIMNFERISWRKESYGRVFVTRIINHWSVTFSQAESQVWSTCWWMRPVVEHPTRDTDMLSAVALRDSLVLSTLSVTGEIKHNAQYHLQRQFEGKYGKQRNKVN